MQTRHVALAVLGVGIVAAVVLVAVRPGPQAQVEDCFTRIERAIEDYRAGDLVAQVDERYDFRARWDFLAPVVDEAERQAERHEGVDASAMVREAIRQQVALLFLSLRQRDVTADFTWQVHEVRRDAELVEADVTIGLTGAGFPAEIHPPRRHRFTLSSDGLLWPTLRIRSHDSIALL